MTRLALSIGSFAVAATMVSLAQTGREAGRDWPYSHGDLGSTRYSTLTQIDTANVQNLKRAWTFHTGSGRFASAPMAVDGVLYFSAPNGVYAIDGVTGEPIWKYAPPRDTAPPAVAAADDTPTSGRAAAPGARGRAGGGRFGGAADNAGTAVRGPAYWRGANGLGPRVYSSTSLGLTAIDAKTGKIVSTFGNAGALKNINHASPPLIYKDLLITKGDEEAGKGANVKAFDVVTGRLRWTFYLKAQPGDPNRATWLNGSADTDATPGLWGMFTIDDQRGTLFVPVEKVEGNGASDYWAGGNHGSGLYGDSLVALDAATGKMKWHQQLVHHDIWDYDVAAAPVLIDVRRNGRVIPAVAQSTKMALLFIFNRETGEPMFGMEERPVPQTSVPGEWTSRTQPFPIKPEPLSRNRLTRADLAKVTPEHQKFCEDLWDTNKLGDAVPYAPWKVGENTLVFPGAQGGSNWWGAAFNKPLGLVIANVHNSGQWGRLEPSGDGYRKTPGPFARFWNSETRWSCTAPPWGELVAVNANTGDVAWRVPLGEFEALTARGVPPTGTPNSGGAITTAGNLIFIGATIDGYFRAFDARNGKELWRDKLTVPSQGTPTTFMGRDGKQYVVIGANGGGFFGAPAGDEVIAYAVR